MQIQQVCEADTRLLDSFNALLGHLSDTAPRLTDVRLQRIVDDQCCSLFVALQDGAVIGCLTLSVFPVLTDVRAWIDDVVVDPAYQGQGVGRRLLLHALEAARFRGALSVNLTCNPRRKAANALYTRMGFKQRQTHVYRYELL